MTCPEDTKLCVWDPPRPHPMLLFIWLVLICFLANKTVIISTVILQYL